MLCNTRTELVGLVECRIANRQGVPSVHHESHRGLEPDDVSSIGQPGATVQDGVLSERGTSH